MFFTGCNLQCIYCQNHDISGKDALGVEITSERLTEIFLDLQDKGALNINLVTGTPYIPYIAEALSRCRYDGSLHIPVIWNSGGYESTGALEMLDGLVDVWMPDFKTMSGELGKKFMNAPDYPERASKALDWMVAHSHPVTFVSLDDPSGGVLDVPDDEIPENALMISGVCVRHLVMPGHVSDTRDVLDYLAQNYGSQIIISLMSQYTPMRNDFIYPELNRILTKREYDRAVSHAVSLGLTRCMIQEGKTASESFIPAFDGTGISDSK